jgi:hypothetical protein
VVSHIIPMWGIGAPHSLNPPDATDDIGQLALRTLVSIGRRTRQRSSQCPRFGRAVQDSPVALSVESDPTFAVRLGSAIRGV